MVIPTVDDADLPCKSMCVQSNENLMNGFYICICIISTTERKRIKKENIHHSLLAVILSLSFSVISSVSCTEITVSLICFAVVRRSLWWRLSGRGCVCAWCWESALYSSASLQLLSCAWAAEAVCPPISHTHPALQNTKHKHTHRQETQYIFLLG